MLIPNLAPISQFVQIPRSPASWTRGELAKEITPPTKIRVNPPPTAKARAEELYESPKITIPIVTAKAGSITSMIGWEMAKGPDP